MTSTNHQENAVLLQQSASQLVAEQQDGRQLVAAAPLTPCSLAGLGPAISGAALGLLFGSGSAMFGHLWGFVSRKPLSTPLLSTAWQSGVASAKTFAIMSGVYSTAVCFVTRIRQKQDELNGAAAGCMTGVALGWGTGPAACAQSCLMVGALTYVMERMGGVAQAAAVGHAMQHTALAAQKTIVRGVRGRRTNHHGVLSLALPLQHACSGAVGACWH